MAGSSDPKEPTMPILPKDPSISPASPLITTHRERQFHASSMPSSDMTAKFEMEDYARDVEAVETDGTSALAPAPAFDEQPAAPPVNHMETVPSRFDAVEEHSATASSPVARALQLLRGNPRVQLIVLAAAVTFLVTLLVFRESDGVSLSTLRKNAVSFDGQTVKVRGRVGEVFQMGASYAYNLHQGRDTIVVFTRSHAPVPHERITVTGSLSTGYLEGAPRLALFESPSASKSPPGGSR